MSERRNETGEDRITYELKNFYSDGLEGAYLLGTIVGILDSELEWSLTIVEDRVSLSERWVHLVDCREVKGVKD